MHVELPFVDIFPRSSCIFARTLRCFLVLLMSDVLNSGPEVLNGLWSYDWLKTSKTLNFHIINPNFCQNCSMFLARYRVEIYDVSDYHQLPEWFEKIIVENLLKFLSYNSISDYIPIPIAICTETPLNQGISITIFSFGECQPWTVTHITYSGLRQTCHV